MDITPAAFAVLLTASGAPIGAAIIQQAISFLRDGLNLRVVAGREKLAAFLSAVIIVIIAVAVGLSEMPPRYEAATTIDAIMLGIGMILAIYNIGRMAMAIYDDRMNDSTASIRNASGWRRPVDDEAAIDEEPVAYAGEERVS
jgi:hypothetical protein